MWCRAVWQIITRDASFQRRIALFIVIAIRTSNLTCHKLHSSLGKCLKPPITSPLFGPNILLTTTLKLLPQSATPSFTPKQTTEVTVHVLRQQMGKQKILNWMAENIPKFPILKFFVNGILICYWHSQTFPHIFEEFIISLYIAIFYCILMVRHEHIYCNYFIEYIFPSLMQQKVIVTLILYSQHVLAIHSHHQVSVAMLNSCTVLHVTTASTHQVNNKATTQAEWWVNSQRDIYKRNQHSHQHPWTTQNMNMPTLSKTVLTGPTRRLELTGFIKFNSVDLF
jgi:hypothetical protein